MKVSFFKRSKHVISQLAPEQNLIKYVSLLLNPYGEFMLTNNTSNSAINLALMIFFGSSIGVGKDSGARTVLVFNLLVKCVGLINPELGTGGTVALHGGSSIEEALLEQLPSLFW